MSGIVAPRRIECVDSITYYNRSAVTYFAACVRCRHGVNFVGEEERPLCAYAFSGQHETHKNK